MKTSEYGQGFVYPIGLFLGHMMSTIEPPSTWFNGASDHLYDLKIPSKFPKALKARIIKWRDHVLNLGHGEGLMNSELCTQKEKDDALREAKDILMEVDKWLHVKVIQGDYE